MTAPARCHAGSCVRMGRAGPGLCGSCARLSGGWLADLPSLVHALAEPPGAEPDGAHSVAHDWRRCWTCLHHVFCGHTPRCGGHVAVLVSAGLTRGTDGEPVSGSRVPPIPVSADVLSLLGPSAGWDRSHLDHGDERTGELQDGREPLGVTLTYWCARVAVECRMTMPQRDATSLLRFLSVHHDWTVKQSWADEYAQDVYRLWLDCKRLTGTFDGRPEPMKGVPCRKCDRVALVRIPGEDGRLCDPRDGGCGEQMTDEEYERWTKLLDFWVKTTA